MQNRQIAGNRATGVLKMIALALMMCDHMGKMLFPGVIEMRGLGRSAFPLYAWCLVVGATYTRSMAKYMLRLAAIGLISQPLYMVALNHTWREPNIFFTLLVALGALWGIREKKWLSHIWAPVMALAAAVLLKCDYSWQGVLLILLLYAVRDRRSGIAAVMIAFCLYWGGSSRVISELFGVSLSVTGTVLPSLLYPWLRLQTMAILALPLILWPCKKKLILPAWLGYALYPAHLIVLWALERI